MAPRSKLAVMLHADVVGSTMLVHIDERLAHERIQGAFRRLAAAISSYSGVTREVRGDALVAEFERASDAVSAALKFQSENIAANSALTDGVRPDVRIGVALGEVILADDTVTGAGVVLAQRLEQLADPGALCISAAVREALPARLPYEYGPLGEQSVKGFDEPVRVFLVALGEGADIPAPEPAEPPRSAGLGGRWRAAVAVLALVLVGAAAWLQPWGILDQAADSEASLPLPDKPSLVALPLKNLSGDPSQDGLADAISEGITTELSRFADLFVISPDSANFYRGRDKTSKQIGRELGVRYLLTGSLQREGDRMRVTAQLMEADSGTQVWSEKYDREVVDVFVVQDEVVQAVVTSLGETVWRSAAARLAAKPLADFAAFDYWLQGREVFHKLNREANEEARGIWKKGLEIDPELGFLYLGLAWSHYMDYRAQWTETGPEALDTASDYLRRASRTMGEHYGVHRLMAKIAQLSGQYDKAVAHNTRALELNPNDGDLLAAQGQMLTYAGESREARRWVEEAMRRNPHYPGWYASTLSLIQYLQKDYEGAIATLNRIGELSIWDHRYLAAAYGQLGKAAEGRKHLEAVLEANPDFSLDRFGDTLKFRLEQDKSHFLDGLRKSGFPA